MEIEAASTALTRLARKDRLGKLAQSPGEVAEAEVQVGPAQELLPDPTPQEAPYPKAKSRFPNQRLTQRRPVRQELGLQQGHRLR